MQAVKSDSTAPPPLSKAALMRELSTFARPSNKMGLLLFVRDYLLYWSLIAAVLFVPSMPLKILASVLVGIRLTSFYTLAHDASHRTLVASRPLNWWLAMLLGVPSFQNYRMWTHDHNMVHHPKTNGDHFDFYRPYSKKEFDSLSKFEQLMERVYRAPNVVGLWLYFMIRWLPTRLSPNPRTPKTHRTIAWRYSLVLVGYHSLFVTMLCLAPGFSSISLTASLLLGWILPLCVHTLISSASLYLMHTHRKIPWFKGEISRTGDYAPELCSTVFTLPDWLSKIVNNVYCHAVHHAHAGISSYHALEAQKHMNKLLGNRMVVEPMSLQGAIATMKACKLYDFEKHQWLDFNGSPSASPINLSARGA
ncbi:MAG: fatty acid desaturase [Rhodoferax sp.]